MQFEDLLVPSHTTDPKTESSGQGSNGKGSDLEEPPELKPMVASFLRGLPKTSEDKDEETSPEPPVREFSQWVSWKAERCKTPKWWLKLSTVPGRDDSRKLAREVWASFRLPWQMQELGLREATLQTPPALPSLHRQKFMLQTKPIYACRDIREVPRDKSGGICHGPPALGRAK